MTALLPGTPLFEQVFGGADLGGTFEANGPSYTDITSNYLNPALAAQFSDPAVLQADQARDIRNGLRFVVRDLAVAGEETDVNVPRVMLVGMGQVIKSAEIDVALTELGVGKLFSAVQGGDPAKIAGALLGTAMGAVGLALPVVGLIGAAIVGFALGVVGIFTAREKKQAKDAEEERARLYRSFPPLQIADSPFDGKVVQKLLRPKLRTRDWTPIYLPQFEDETWVGLEREGGYAFAPGQTGTGDDEFGDSTEVFSPGVGLGVMPGSDRVTAVIQVSLIHDKDADNNEAWTAFAKGGKDPRGIDDNGVRGWTRVHDTGMYFPATGRIAASIWEMATADSKTAEGMTAADRARLKMHGNPLRYRLDALRLHAAWRRWAEGGLRYIREVCYPWGSKWIRGDGTVNPDANLEGFFGTGVYDAVGAWCCLVSGGGTYNVYPAPYGILGPELAASPEAYGKPDTSMSSSYSGSFLPILDKDRWPDKCMGEVYSRGEVSGVRPCLKTILDHLRKAQQWEVKNTLVSAYVSEKDAAFAGDAKLRDALRATRAKLLTSEDRFFVDLGDVTDAEPRVEGLAGKAATWREQLLAAGVPLVPATAVPSRMRLAAGGAAPVRPGFNPGQANPFEPTPPPRLPRRVPRARKKSGAGSAIALGVVGLGLGTALATIMAARGKKRRAFSAGTRKHGD